MSYKIGIECTSYKEAKQVAAFYNWKHLGATIGDFEREGNHIITLENGDNTPAGWARSKWYQTLEPNDHYAVDKVIAFKEWAKANNQLKEEINMKYVVEVNNQEEANLVIKTLKLDLNSYYFDYPYIVTSNGNHGSPKYHKSDGLKHYGPVLTFKDWALMFDVELKPKKTLKLTNDYNAVVSYSEEVVQVGCQSIPFKTVEALAKLIKE